jgi:hypothetical protein
MKVLSKQEIFLNYSGQWVLIGNPRLDPELPYSSVANNLKDGIPLFSSIDKNEVAQKAKFYRKDYASFACIYTGKLEPRNWLL